jgi:hypothetical protein
VGVVEKTAPVILLTWFAPVGVVEKGALEMQRFLKWEKNVTLLLLCVYILSRWIAQNEVEAGFCSVKSKMERSDVYDKYTMLIYDPEVSRSGSSSLFEIVMVSFIVEFHLSST